MKTLQTQNDFNLQDEDLLGKLGLDSFFVNKKRMSFKNFCFFVGRGRSVSRDFYMARHTFRKFARFGLLPGIIKERC